MYHSIISMPFPSTPPLSYQISNGYLSSSPTSPYYTTERHGTPIDAKRPAMIFFMQSRLQASDVQTFLASNMTVRAGRSCTMSTYNDQLVVETNSEQFSTLSHHIISSRQSRLLGIQSGC